MARSFDSPLAVAPHVQVVSKTLYYLHSDHPGSTSLATTTGGAVVAGSTARYLPFGGWRTTPTAGLTDIGFTSHRHNNIGTGTENIGLIYMNARWYLPGIGRFASADTIVPDPQNPQSYNRYTYGYNNPVKNIDPDGHCAFGFDTAVCIHIIVKILTGLVDWDLQDGKFDTPAYIQTTVATTMETVFGNPFASYRDENLASLLSSGSSTPDVTSWLVQTMNANAAGTVAQILRESNSSGADGKYAAYLGWTAMVKGGAPWDFKPEFAEKRIDTVILGGYELNMDVVANIHYGYVGRASGFSLGELQVGAGVAQVFSGTSDWGYWASHWDDPRDQFGIWLGAWLFDNYPNQSLTEDIFNQAMQQYHEHLNQ